MKKNRIITIAIAVLLLIAQSSVVAMAAGNPDPADMAVYVKNNFTGNSARIEGSIYSAEGNITYNNAGDNVLSGDAYHKTGTSFAPPVGFSGNDTELNDTEFDAVFPDLAAFPVISNIESFTPAWNAPQVVVTEDAHFNNLIVGQYDGLDYSPIVVDTTLQDIKMRVGALSYQWGYSIKVIGGGKLYLYVDSFSGTAPLVIDNGGDPDKTIIVSKSALKFGDNSSTQMHAHVYYTGVSSLVHQGTLIGSLASDGSTLTISGGKNIVNGPVYAPTADVTLQSPGYDDDNALAPSVNGRVVAKSLTVTGAGYVKHDPSHATFTVPPEILVPEDPDPEDPDPEIPDFPDLPDPDGYNNGLLGTYYDSYEPMEQAKKLARIDSNIEFNYGYGEYPHESMGRENFSIVWEGYFRAPATGTYVFRTFSDDGVKLFVDGDQIINNWGLYSLNYLTSTSITLSEGQLYPIQLDYQQGPLYAAVYLFWEYNGVNMGLVPNEHLFVEDSVYTEFAPGKLYHPLDEQGTGFINRFYTITSKNDDPTGGTPDFDETNNINYNWGGGAPDGISTDMFFGTMEGLLEAKFTENLTLIFTVDDAIRVWVDGTQVIDEWGYHSRTTFEHTFSVVSGQKYLIKVEYADFMLSGSVHMGWKSDSIKSEIVPIEYMYPNE